MGADCTLYLARPRTKLWEDECPSVLLSLIVNISGLRRLYFLSISDTERNLLVETDIANSFLVVFISREMASLTLMFIDKFEERKKKKKKNI